CRRGMKNDIEQPVPEPLLAENVVSPAKGGVWQPTKVEVKPRSSIEAQEVLAQQVIVKHQGMSQRSPVQRRCQREAQAGNGPRPGCEPSPGRSRRTLLPFPALLHSETAACPARSDPLIERRCR